MCGITHFGNRESRIEIELSSIVRLITLFGNATNATNAKCQLKYFSQNVVSIQNSCIFGYSFKETER